MAYGGGASVGAYIAMVQAVKASGAIVRLEPDGFMTILSKIGKPLVVMSPGSWLNKGYQYLTSYKGLAFYTKSSTQLLLGGSVELVAARQIWIPN